MQLTETRSSYVIPSVEESDTGRYLCKVNNSLGIEEAFADVNVLGKIMLTNYHFQSGSYIEAASDLVI